MNHLLSPLPESHTNHSQPLSMSPIGVRAAGIPWGQRMASMRSWSLCSPDQTPQSQSAQGPAGPSLDHFQTLWPGLEDWWGLCHHFGSVTTSLQKA